MLSSPATWPFVGWMPTPITANSCCSASSARSRSTSTPRARHSHGATDFGEGLRTWLTETAQRIDVGACRAAAHSWVHLEDGVYRGALLAAVQTRLITPHTSSFTGIHLLLDSRSMLAGSTGRLKNRSVTAGEASCLYA